MTLDYLKTISSPMDLSTIKLKIDRRKYKTVAEFDQDVTLMLHNCFHYNEEGAWVATVSKPGASLFLFVGSILYVPCVSCIRLCCE